MLEIPEAIVISAQIVSQIKGKRIVNVIVGQSPHKLAWMVGEGREYHDLLMDKVIERACPLGGMIEIIAGSSTMVFSDGVNLSYFHSDEPVPEKHQLLLTFDDLSHMCAAVQMYGGIICFDAEAGYDNPYYEVAQQKPSPLADAFDFETFKALAAPDAMQKLSLKAFLATEQRIPGLGNGVLQDILWHAGLNPRQKLINLQEDALLKLFKSIKETLEQMVKLGGRNTEKDLFGKPGGYETVMSAKNSERICPKCGSAITKESYMGGSVYYCGKCQELK